MMKPIKVVIANTQTRHCEAGFLPRCGNPHEFVKVGCSIQHPTKSFEGIATGKNPRNDGDYYPLSNYPLFINQLSITKLSIIWIYPSS
jgi:hypothetical protein